jgi:hypothetical protein
MRPVVLSVVDGKNFLLGSFDTTNFQTWWKSEPFPGAVDIIRSPIHVYGQYHVCIVKMTNGTYSIYRTKNMGKSWTQVYNTPNVIYTLTAIDYGWIVGSTSAGWIESKLDSGYTWTSISSFAPGCKTVININDDILFAHDGTNIWRSTDYARTWSIKLSKTGWTSLPYHPGYPVESFSWNSNAYPALTGINKFVAVGFGPYLVISDDLGENWTTHPTGSHDSWYKNNGWGRGMFGPAYYTNILQLVHTSMEGKSPNDTTIMARVLDNSTNRVYYMCSGPYTPALPGLGTGTGFLWSDPVYIMSYNGYENGIITASDVQNPGASTHSHLATITVYQNNTPIVLYSINGGYNWAGVNASSVTVYEGDPAQEIVSPIGQQVFDEEYFTTYTWVGAACHNTGRYIDDFNKTVRCISFDVDFLNTFRKTKTLSDDIILMKVKYKTCTYDILNKKTNIKTYTPDVALLKYNITHNCLMDECTQKTFLKTCTSDVANAERVLLPLLQDATIQKTCNKTLFTRTYINGSLEKTCEMGIKIVDNHVDEIMNSIERYTLQVPDIRYPSIPYKPFDSRTQEVNL